MHLGLGRAVQPIEDHTKASQRRRGSAKGNSVPSLVLQHCLTANVRNIAPHEQAEGERKIKTDTYDPADQHIGQALQRPILSLIGRQWRLGPGDNC